MSSGTARPNPAVNSDVLAPGFVLDERPGRRAGYLIC